MSKYTGEGFRGEKLFALTAVLMTIISSALLIHLSMLQKKHTELQIDRLENGDD